MIKYTGVNSDRFQKNVEELKKSAQANQTAAQTISPFQKKHERVNQPIKTDSAFQNKQILNSIYNKQPTADSPFQKTQALTTATQKLMSKPVEENWYKGETPTASEIDARIYKIGLTDKQKANELWTEWQGFRQDKSSPYYQPYVVPTNQAIQEMENLGFDMSKGVTQEWLDGHSYLKNYYRLGTGGTPLAPSKTSTPEENAAYWYYHLLTAEETTTKAELEAKALREEISYWANRDDRNLTDDEILAMFDWKKNPTLAKKYPTLAKLDADRKAGTPTILNRAIDYDPDQLDGMIWAARNGSSGNTAIDSVHAVLGDGIGYKENKEITAKRKKESASYSPYSLGSTLDDAAFYFGVQDFSPEWVRDHMYMLDSMDETEQKMFLKVYQAEQTTVQAQKELDDLWAHIDEDIGFGMSSDLIMQDVLKGYDTLKRLDKSIENKGDLVGTTRAIDFSMNELRAEVERRCAAEEAKNSGFDFVENANSVLSGYKDLAEYVGTGLYNLGKMAWDGYKENLSNEQATVDQAPEKSKAVSENTKAIIDSKNKTASAASPVIMSRGTSAEKNVFKTASVDFENTVDGLGHVMANADMSGAVAGTKSTADRRAYDGYLGVAPAVRGYMEAMKMADAAQAQIDQLTAQVDDEMSIEQQEELTGRIDTLRSQYEGYKARMAELEPEFQKALPKYSQMVEDQGAAEWTAGKGAEAMRKFIIAPEGMSGEDLQYEVEMKWIKDYENGNLFRDLKYYKGLELIDQIDKLEAEKQELESKQSPWLETDKKIRELVNGFSTSANPDDDWTTDDQWSEEIYPAILEFAEQRGLTEEQVDEAMNAYMEQNNAYLKFDLLNNPDLAEIKWNQFESILIGDKEIPASGLTAEEEARLSEVNKNIAALDHELEMTGTKGLEEAEKERIDKEFQRYLSLAEDKGRTSTLASMNSIYEYGKYDPTDWSSNTKYDRMRDESYDASQIQSQAVSDIRDIERELTMVYRDLAEIDIHGINAGEYGTNLRRRAEKLERDKKQASYELLSYRDDFKQVVEEERKKGADVDVFIKQHELDIYYYIRHTEGEEAAREYHDFLTDPTYGILTVRASEALRKDTQELSDKFPILMTGVSVLTSPLEMGGTLYALYAKLTDQEISPAHPAFAFSTMKQTVRSTVSEGMPYIGQIIYNGGTSALDSAWNGFLFGGLTSGAPTEACSRATSFFKDVVNGFASASPMGIEAASSAIMNAKMKGANDDQAMLMGLITFACETGTEAITLNNMMAFAGIGSGEEAKSIVGQFLRSYAEEVFGEEINEILEYVADNQVMGMLGDRDQAIAKYMDEYGITEEQAKLMADKDFLNTLLETALTTMISTGITDSVGYAKGRVEQRTQGIQQIIDSGITSSYVIARDLYNMNKQYEKQQQRSERDFDKAYKKIQANEKKANRINANAQDLMNSRKDSAKKTAEIPAETTAEMPVETPAETPVETITETPVETPVRTEEDIAKDAEQATKDVALLTASVDAKNSSMAATITAVLGGTYGEINHLAMAAAQTMVSTLGENQAANLIRATRLVAQQSGKSIADINNAIEVAVTGMGQASQVFADLVENGVTAENVASLVEATQEDMQNPQVTSTIEQTVHDNRIGNKVYDQAANGALDSAKAASEEVIKANAELDAANDTLEAEQQTSEALAESMQDAMQKYLENPGDQDAEAQKTKALEAYKGQQAVVDQSKQAVDNAKQRVEEAQRKADETADKALTTVREGANADVEVENQAMQEAEAKREEEQLLAEQKAAQEKAEEDKRSGKAEEDRVDSIIEDLLNTEHLDGEERDNRRAEYKKRAEQIKLGKIDMTGMMNNTEGYLAISAFGRKLGLQFQLSDKIGNARGMYKDGVVYLNSDLVKNGKMTIGQALVEGALHEITHSMEATGAYRTYSRIVLDALYGQDRDMAKYNAAIKQKQIQYKNAVGQELTNEQAEKEIVADFARTHLNERDVVERFIDNGIGGKMRNALHNINQALRNFRLKGQEKIDAEYLRRAERAFQKGLDQIAKTAIHPEGGQFSIPQFAQAAGLTFNEATQVLYDKDGNEIDGVENKVTKKMFEGTPVARLIDSGLRLKTITAEHADKVFDQFTRLMNMCARYRNSDMIWEIASATLDSEFSAIKGNADKQYSTTVDFGTICAKTQAIVDQLSRDMLAAGRGLTAKEILQVYNDVYESNLTVPCPVCYVFSRWMGVPSLLNAMKEYQDRFLGKQGESRSIEEIQSAVDQYVTDAQEKYGIDKNFGANVAKAKKAISDKIEKSKNTVAELEESLANKTAALEAKRNAGKKTGQAERSVVTAQNKLNEANAKLSQLETGLENVEVQAYGKAINAVKTTIEGNIKKANDKLDGGDTGNGLLKQIEDAKKRGEDVSKLEAKRDQIVDERDALYKKLSEVDGYNWVTQALCYMDDSGRFVVDPNFERTPDEILFDLNRTAEFSKYVKNWKYRTTRGAGMGKAILPYSGATIGDSVYGMNARRSVNSLLAQSEDTAAIDQAVKNAINRARQQNLIGGQRFQSTSDYRAEWGLDYIMTFLEQQVIGSCGQLYTKVAEAVPLFAKAGIDTNLSIMPFGDGYHIDENGNVVLDFSDVTGMDINIAKELKNQYDNVQLILVGINDTHILAALKDGDITFVIPWHSSGNSRGQLAAMMSSVNEKLNESSDYTKLQSDAKYEGESTLVESAKTKIANGEELTDEENAALGRERRRNVREKILTGGFLHENDAKGSKKKPPTASEMEVIKSSEYLSSLYNRFYEDKNSDCYGVKMTSSQASQIFPYEYWQTDPTQKGGRIETADENGKRFCEYCKELGYVPRFSGREITVKDENGKVVKNEDGTDKTVTYGNFSGMSTVNGERIYKPVEGYWKLLIDRSMYGLDGNYRAQQKIDVTGVNVGNLEENNGKYSLKGSDLKRDDIAPNNKNRAKYRLDTEENLEAHRKASQKFDERMGITTPVYDMSYQFSAYGDGETTAADLEQMLYQANEDYQSAMDRGDTTGAAKDLDFIRESIGENAAMDTEYMYAVNHGDMDTAQRLVNDRANAVKAEVFAATDVPTYKVRRGYTPKKTITVYKTFTLDSEGRPSALFVSSQHAIPVGVWLDAQDTYHFTNTKNGRMYVPSTKNPNTAGGATGRSMPLTNISAEQLAELEERGYIKRGANGKYTVKNITALAYRPGWHAGDLPFFPQGGMEIEGSNYEKVHRYNQVVFECEMAVDTDYTSYDIREDGSIKYHDMQQMPENGSYKFATNPMANAMDIGAWYISGALKINRALTEEECNQILAENGRAPQEWQQYQDADVMKGIRGKEGKYNYEHTMGPLDLDALNYDPTQTDGGKKLLDPVTYDDEGNVIPLSQRFNSKVQDPRYSAGGEMTTADMEQMYMDAVNRGDMETARQDVRSYAEAKGYTEIWTHGTPNASFTSFDLLKAKGAKAVFLSDPSTASEYAGTTYRGVNTRLIGGEVTTIDDALEELKRINPEFKNVKEVDGGYSIPRSQILRNGLPYKAVYSDSDLIDAANKIREKNKGGVYRLLVNPGKMLKVDARGAWWDRINSEYGRTTDQIGEWARRNGYDSVEIDNVHDGGFNDAIPSDILLVFDGNRMKSTETVTYDDQGNVIPLSERFNLQNQDIRYSAGGDLTTADIDQKLINSGAITQEELDAYNGTSQTLPGPVMPTDEGPAQRQFGYVKAQESNALHQEVKDYLYTHSNYTPDTNAAQIDRAIAWVQSHANDTDTEGYYGAVREVESPNFDYRSADGQVRMLTLMGMAALKGDIATEMRLADAYNKQGTDLGRMLQARKLFRLMTPLGRQSYLQKQMDEINAEYGRKGSNRMVALSEWTMRAAAEAKTEQEFQAVQQAANKELADQMPADWKDKLRGWRMLSMLGNPRTHIRNILGNALFMPAVGIKNKIAALGEIIDPKVKAGERTKTLGLASPEARAFAKQDALTVKDDLTGEAKYKDKNGVQSERKTWGTGKGIISKTLGKALQAVSDFNGNALEFEDWIFLKRHYRNALAGYMTANKLKAADMTGDTLEKARIYAIQEAQKATYRDANKLAETLSRIGREGGAPGFFVNAVLPFKKTPANILKRGVEYSPVGLLDALVVDGIHMKQFLDFQKGKLSVLPEKAISPAQWIDKISAGLTGTGIMALGALLSSLGVVSAGMGDDDDEFDKLRGEQQYAINLNLFGQDVSITADWAAPMSMPFFVGATVYDTVEKMVNGGDVDVGKLAEAMLDISEPVFNLSMLDGVNSLMDTNSYGEGNTLTQIGEKILTNYATSYVPTVVGQLARTIDTTRRKAFVESGSSFQTERYAWEKLENKIPFLSMSNIPYRDVWGNVDESSALGAGLENFLSPAYINEIKDDFVVGELERLYKETKDSVAIPKMPAKKVGGEKVTAEEYDRITVDRGQAAHEILNGLFTSSEYQMADAETKLKMVELAWKYATQTANNKAFGSKMDKWISEADDPVQAIIDKTVASNQKAQETGYKKAMVESINNNDTDSALTSLEALRRSGMTDQQIKDYLGNQYRDQYKAAFLAGDRETVAEISRNLLAMNVGFTTELFKKWQQDAMKK